MGNRIRWDQLKLTPPPHTPRRRWDDRPVFLVGLWSYLFVLGYLAWCLWG